jgi:DNA-binding NarL/FixJ family response regulator
MTQDEIPPVCCQRVLNMPTAIKYDNSATHKRIFVVDDHPMIREGLAAQIASEPNLELCGEADDLVEAISGVAAAQPDLVIVDISLKSGNGIDLVKRLKAKDPSLVILVWSMYPENLYAERALRAGARGYVNKGQSAVRIMEAIRTILDGRTYVSPEMSEKLLGRVIGHACEEGGSSYVDRFTDRELEAFELLGRGLTTQQIAARMHISHKTVETYRARIKEKLGLTNAMELVQRAVQWVMGKAEST